MSHTHDVPPDVLAVLDQSMAQTDDAVMRLVETFRESVSQHDGDTLCAFRYVLEAGMSVSHFRSSLTLAAAVKRIAFPPAEDPRQ